MTEQETHQLLINAVVNQRDQAMNAVAQLQTEVAILKAKLADFENVSKETKPKKEK